MRRNQVAGGVVALLLVVAAVAVASRHVPVPVPDDPFYAEFTPVADAPWDEARGRRCGLIDVAETPARAGASLRGTLRYSKAKNAAALEWAFRDSTGTRVFSAVAANCYSHVKVKGQSRKITWAFTEPAEAVAHDPEVDAAAAASPAFLACMPAGMRLSSPLTVATVVDTDGSVWTTDETTEPTAVRACAARELDAWVRAQIAGGTFHLEAPAVVLGVLRTPPPDPAAMVPRPTAGGATPPPAAPPPASPASSPAPPAAPPPTTPPAP